MNSQIFKKKKSKTDEDNYFKEDYTISINSNIPQSSDIYSGNENGDNFQTGHFVTIREKDIIGNNINIGAHSKIRQPSIIYSGNEIGDNFQTGHFVTVRENNKIGNNVSIGSHSNIEHHIIIEDNVRIHSNCFIPEFSILKHDCWLGPNVVLCNARYPKSIDVKKNLVGPTIQEYAKIGANSTILDGVKVGKHALIGAGTVVAKNVQDYAIVIGNPGEKIGDIRDLNKYNLK